MRITGRSRETVRICRNSRERQVINDLAGSGRRHRVLWHTWRDRWQDSWAAKTKTWTGETNRNRSEVEPCRESWAQRRAGDSPVRDNRCSRYCRSILGTVTSCALSASTKRSAVLSARPSDIEPVDLLSADPVPGRCFCPNARIRAFSQEAAQSDLFVALRNDKSMTICRPAFDYKRVIILALREDRSCGAGMPSETELDMDSIRRAAMQIL